MHNYPLTSEVDNIWIQRIRPNLPQASSLDLGARPLFPLVSFPSLPSLEPTYSVLCPRFPSYSFPAALPHIPSTSQS